MTLVLWIVFGVSTAVVGFAAAIHLWLATWARRGKSGSEIIALALGPLFGTAFLLTWPGGSCGLLLAAHLDTPGLRITTTVFSGLMLTIGTLAILNLIRAWMSVRKASTLDSRYPDM
ncbi:hypothetical protein [Actinokineospora sp. HUAS TT18]|uniref:hypothetical protein n=1 Tax=Actinokineospora sp. HUAS TT18 TaxID=3447451 RepID=UPI003F51CF66